MMTKLIPFLLLSLPSLAQQPLFKSNGYFPHTEQINQLKSADLNGNGLNDLVVVTAHQLGVLIYWNQGAGQFVQATQKLNLPATDEVLIEDFDGDGDLDLWAGTVNQGGTFIDYAADYDVLFSSGWPTITRPDTPYQLLINDGSGVFKAANSGIQALRRVDFPRYEALDLDSDGDKDLITYSKAGEEITDLKLFSNDGLANFSSHNVDIELLRFVVFFDYNADGHIDIWTLGRDIGAENTQQMVIYLNDGQGIFNQENLLKIEVDGLINETVDDVLTADVNGDGRDDLVLINAGKIITLIQQTNGSFNKTVQQPGGHIRHVSMIDNDAGGQPDLMVSLSSQSGTSIWRHTAGQWQSVETIVPHDAVIQHVADDFNADGSLEVATLGPLGIQFWQLNDQAWTETTQTATQTEWISPRLVATADVNNDGLVDLLLAGKSGIHFRAGNGRGSFAEIQEISTLQAYDWAWGDVNQDSQIDLVVANKQGVYLLLNQGLNGFSQQLIFDAEDNSPFFGLILQDLNNDQRAELVVLIQLEGVDVYSWHVDQMQLADGLTGEFSGAFTFDQGNGVHSLMLSKSGLEADSVPLAEYLLIDETLNFQQNILDSSDDYDALFSNNPWVFDYDGDGDNDILLDEPTDNFGNYSLLVNNQPDFEMSDYYLPDSIFAFPKAMGDFNLDGEIDFIAPLRVGIVSFQETLLLNDGNNNNNLWDQQTFGDLSPLGRLHTVDIDGDGDLDLLSLNNDFLSVVSSGGISTFINSTIDQDFTGQWYNPAQSGHGLQVEEVISNGVPQVNLSWYVFDQGKPVWLTGVGPIVGNSATIPMAITRGPEFGDAFDSEDLVLEYWGDVVLTLNNAQNMSFSWDGSVSGFEAGEMQLSRLSVVKPVSPELGVINSCHTGSWYNVDESGHGIMAQVVEVEAQDTLIITWFTYLNGEQYWIYAQGPIAGNRAILSAKTGSGGQFPPNYNAEDVTFNDWGELEFKLIDNQHAELLWTPDIPEFDAGSLNLTRLTQLDRYRCQ